MIAYIKIALGVLIYYLYNLARKREEVILTIGQILVLFGNIAITTINIVVKLKNELLPKSAKGYIFVSEFESIFWSVLMIIYVLRRARCFGIGLLPILEKLD